MEITKTVTRDAVVGTTKKGKGVVNFTVAIGDGYRAKSGQWVEKTQFIQCSYWRSTSEAVRKILLKGATVQLYGNLEPPRIWTDRNGNPRASLVFNTASIKPLRKPNPSQAATPKQETANLPANRKDSDDLPF